MDVVSERRLTNNMDTVESTTSGADSATANASPDSSATSQSATPDSTATAQTSPDVSSATSGGAEAASSSPTDTRVAQDAQSSAQTQAAIDYKKRYDELKGQYDRTVPQLRQYEQRLRQYDGVDPNVINQWRQAQQQAQQKNLPRYAPQHPEHGAFQQLRQKVQWARATIAKAPAEQREQVKAAMAAQFSDQEMAEFEQWEGYRENFMSQFSTDPVRTVGDLVGPMVQQAVQRALQEEQVRQQVAQQIQSNDVRPIIEKHGAELKRLMEEEQLSWPMALKFVQMQEQLGALSNTAGQAVALQASANAQFNQRKAAAAISADPKADKVVDPKEVAKQRGIQVGTSAYLDLLDELNSKGLLRPRA